MKIRSSSKSKIKNLLKNNDGAVLIELAIALPVLLLIIFGGVELGIYFMKQHIVARAVNSVIIPLQLNPSDPRREIEMQIRNSGMGLVDFAVGNNKGNFVCARAYSDFETAKSKLCSVENTFDNGWHPEAGFWVMNPMRPYYVVVLAHARYRSLIGLKGILPDIQEWHIFQVNPFAGVPAVVNVPTPAAPAPSAPVNDNTPPLFGGGNNNSGRNNNNNDKTIEDAARQLNDIITKMGKINQR